MEIYKITNLLNSKIYIGKDVSSDPKYYGSGVIINNAIKKYGIENFLKENIIEISPLAYMRGRTFKNAYIIADEMQNATPNQMKMLLTRLGEGSKMVITGDLAQADRLKDNGLIEFCKLLESVSKLEHINVQYFETKDIERHDAVKEVLKVYGD
jgi:phosphate starvation-inducible PhoH-like protein